MPWDNLSTLEAAGTQRKAATGIANDAAEPDFQERYYGNFTPNGVPDINNPYSQAALLESQHINARRADVNSAGNQLYAGSTKNRLNQADLKFNIAQNAQVLQEQGVLAKIEGKDQGYEQEGREAGPNASLAAAGRLEKQPIEPQPKALRPRVKQQPKKVVKKGKGK